MFCLFVFFSIVMMSAAAILDFWNFEFLTVGRLTSVELCHHAKFRRNRANCGQDTRVSILCEFDLKMPIHALLGFWGHIPPNDVTHRPNPQKDRLWTGARHLSNKARISVARFELGVWTRKKWKDRTGPENSHKRVIFHHLWRSPHWSDVHEKLFSMWCSPRNHVC